jgi:hypothetical protein
MPLSIIENLDLEKPSFGPSKWPGKLKPAKNSKLPKLPKNCFELVGKGGWPLTSTWITSGRKKKMDYGTSGGNNKKWIMEHVVEESTLR